MKTIIDPIDRDLLRQELNSDRFLRTTRKGGNEIYRVNAENSPAVLQEIGRLRELTFRASGGGTGEEIDLDAHDFGPYAYDQLIVWSVEDQEIIGGYRYKICAEAKNENGAFELSTTHYFEFSDFLHIFDPASNLSLPTLLGTSYGDPLNVVQEESLLSASNHRSKTSNNLKRHTK